MQILSTVGMFIIPCFAYGYLCLDNPISFFQLNKKTKISPTLITISLAILALPFINLLSYINQKLELPASMANIEAWMKSSELAANQLTEQFLMVDNIGGVMLNIFVIAILPAVSEELFFRGTLQNTLTKHTSNHIAIWTCTIIFSAIHLQFYGFIPRMLMGGLFGYMLVWSGSLWLPVIAHFVNNAMAVIGYYFLQNSETISVKEMDAIGTKDTLYIGVISGVITICGIYLLRRSLTIKSASSRKSIGS